MQKLAKDGTFTTNTWETLAKEEAINLENLQSGQWFVHANTFVESADLLSHKSNIGFWLDSDDSIETIKNHISSVDVIAINFPIFTDGRGFSLSQQLREELGFKGEICAIGQFMEEQLFYLKRCGFDSFIVTDDADMAMLNLILNDFSNNYQGSVIEPRPLFKRKVKV